MSLATTPPSGEYGAAGTYRIGMKTDADNQVTNESDENNNGPGAFAQKVDWDAIRVTEPMPVGKWTVVVHGLSSSPYEALLQGNEFYGAMSSRLQQLSADFLPLRHNVANGTVAWMGGAEILPGNLPPGKHYVLFVDWAEVSNYALDFNAALAGSWFLAGLVHMPPADASGEDGFAEATADALIALLCKYGVLNPATQQSTLHQIVAHSRGTVVTTELVGRNSRFRGG